MASFGGIRRNNQPSGAGRGELIQAGDDLLASKG
jgi:hypothetical protein